MTDRFKDALDAVIRNLPSECLTSYYDEIEILREFATEAEQLRKRLAELEKFIEVRGYDIPK